MRIARQRRPYALSFAAPLLAAAVLLAGTGCSSDSGAGSDQLDALRHLPSAGNTSRQVTYLDGEQVRALSKKDKKRYQAVSQPASMLLLGYTGVPWGDALKTDQIDTAIDAGQSGHWDGRFDAAAVSKALEKNGFTSKDQDGMKVLTSHGNSFSIAISDSELFYVTNGKGASPSDPDKGASLAGTKEYQQIADCMGDVYRADYNTLSTKDSVRLSALGQADDSGRNTEVLCVVTKDKATADKLAGKLRALVKDRAPRYDGTKVTTSGGDHPVVRAAVPDSAKDQPGRLVRTDYAIWQAVGDV